jgi:hypothetical protein
MEEETKWIGFIAASALIHSEAGNQPQLCGRVLSIGGKMEEDF